MTTATGLFTSATATPVSTQPLGTKPHIHTAETATATFLDAVRKNVLRNRHFLALNTGIDLAAPNPHLQVDLDKVPADIAYAAFRNAFVFAHKLAEQIADAGERQRYIAVVDGFSNKYRLRGQPAPRRPTKQAPAAPAKPKGPLGPVYITVAKVAATLSARTQQVRAGNATFAQLEVAAKDIIANQRRWDPAAPAGSILEEVRSQMASAKRVLLMERDGLSLDDAETKANAYANAFINRDGRNNAPRGRNGKRGSGPNRNARGNAPDVTPTRNLVLPKVAEGKTLTPAEQQARADAKKAERIRKQQAAQRERAAANYGEQKHVAPKAAKADKPAKGKRR